MTKFKKPFDGQISRYFKEEAPKDIRKAIEKAGKNDILDPSYPYKERMDKDDYEEALEESQIELVKMQRWIEENDKRVVIVFEGRDAAGKGGAIKRLTLNLNPRVANVVALGKPSDRELGEWYFQRYARHLPTAGDMTIFDRSWYNRAGVEPVMGFASKKQVDVFFDQTPDFEKMLVEDEVILIKIWLTVSRAEQLRRFLDREADPLKHWKISPIDVAALGKWSDYTKARKRMLAKTHTKAAPWTVIRSEDKRRARLAVIRTVLDRIPYDGKDKKIAVKPDKKICGAPKDHGELD